MHQFPKLYMFRTVRLSIIRTLFTVHSAMVYVIQVCRQLSSRTAGPALKLSWQNKLVHLVCFITKTIIALNLDVLPPKEKTSARWIWGWMGFMSVKLISIHSLKKLQELKACMWRRYLSFFLSCLHIRFMRI